MATRLAKARELGNIPPIEGEEDRTADLRHHRRQTHSFDMRKEKRKFMQADLSQQQEGAKIERGQKMIIALVSSNSSHNVYHQNRFSKCSRCSRSSNSINSSSNSISNNFIEDNVQRQWQSTLSLGLVPQPAIYLIVFHVALVAELRLVMARSFGLVTLLIIMAARVKPDTDFPADVPDASGPDHAVELRVDADLLYHDNKPA